MYDQKVLEASLGPDPYPGHRMVWGAPPDHEGGILFVGEAPGKNEEIQGEPFVGEAGMLLRSIIREALGLPPAQKPDPISGFYFTNAVISRPAEGSAPDFAPNAKAMASHRSRLMLTIAMYKPKAIVAVGAVAAEQLLGDDLPRRRGLFYEYTVLGHRCPLYLTHHPAYILRDADRYDDLVADIRRAVNLERPTEEATEIVFVATPEDVPTLEMGVLAIDAEMDSLDPGRGKILSASVSDKPRRSVVATEDEAIRGVLGATTGGPGNHLVGHNSLEDEVIFRMNGYDVRFTDDTLLMHYAMDPRKGTHYLKVLAPTKAKITTYEDRIWPYIHVPDDEEKRGFANVPLDVLVEYNGRDSDVDRELYYALLREMDPEARYVYETLLLPARRMLVDSTIQGILINREALEAETKKQMELVQELVQYFGEVNPNSHDQLMALFRREGFDIPDTTEGTLRGLDGDLPARVLQFREEDKVLSAFLLPMARLLSPVDGRLRSTPKLHGTETGRFSYADPNIQQTPERLRHLYIARPGYVFAGWDYNQLEIRTQTWECQDPQMIAAMARNEDWHQATADRLGVDRPKGKRMNFLVQYGGGKKKAAKSLGVSMDEAQKMIDSYFETYKGLREWKDKTVYQMYDNGTIWTPFKRRRVFNYITRRNRFQLEREAANFPPQSEAHDINLLAMLDVYHKTGMIPILDHHDAAFFEVPVERMPQFVSVLRDLVGRRPEQLEDRGVQFPVVIKAGPNWRDMEPVTVLADAGGS